MASKTGTHTTTSTRTMPRLSLIKIQILNVLATTVDDFDDDTRQKVIKAIDNKWFQAFKIYGKNAQDLVQAELMFSIDWERHTLEMKKNKEVSVNAKWGDNAMISEIQNFAQIFADEVQGLNLTTELSYILANGANKNQVLRELNLIEAEPAKWAGKHEGERFSHRDLSELSVSFKIVTE